MKGLMKVSSGGSAIWRGWKVTGLPRVYVRECDGSHSVGKPRKRWIDTAKECLRKRCLDVRQARRMVQDRCEWQGFVRGNVWSVAWGMNL